MLKLTAGETGEGGRKEKGLYVWTDSQRMLDAILTLTVASCHLKNGKYKSEVSVVSVWHQFTWKRVLLSMFL